MYIVKYRTAQNAMYLYISGEIHSLLLKLCSKVPGDIIQLLCTFLDSEKFRIAAGGYHSIAIKQDGSLVS